ncbi:MAG: RidA family protein [Candidatus Helarchaeota archaeon]
MKKEVIMTKNAPAAFGPFSQAVKVGGFVFTSGILPLDPASGKKVSGGIENETKQTLENLRAILETSGSSLNEIVKATIFLTDINDFEIVNSIYSKYFSGDFPARAAIGVNGLAKNAKIEIQAISIQHD